MSSITTVFSPGALVAAYLRDSGGDAQDLSTTNKSSRYLRVGGRGFCLGAGKTRSQEKA
jgi:hypothetical protein